MGGADLGLPLLREVPGSSQGPAHHGVFPRSTSTQPPPCPPPPGVLHSAPLCGHLAISRPWGGLPSRGSTPLLTAEQIPPQKAVAQQHHPCRGPSVSHGARGLVSAQGNLDTRTPRSPRTLPGTGEPTDLVPGVAPPVPTPRRWGQTIRNLCARLDHALGTWARIVCTHIQSPSRACLASSRPGCLLRVTCHLCGWVILGSGSGLGRAR